MRNIYVDRGLNILLETTQTQLAMNTAIWSYLYSLFMLRIPIQLLLAAHCKDLVSTLCSKCEPLCYALMLHRTNHYAPCSDAWCSVKSCSCWRSSVLLRWQFVWLLRTWQCKMFLQISSLSHRGHACMAWRGEMKSPIPESSDLQMLGAV